MTQDSNESKTPEEKMRAEFEQWYVENAFDYENNPIGSRECGLQWKAWRACAAQSAATIARLEDSAKIWHSRYTEACQRHSDRLTKAGSEIIALQEKLAAAEADNVRLREALEHAQGVAAGKPYFYSVASIDRALSKPLPTSALDAHVAEKTKELQDKVDALKWRPIETAPKDGTHIIVADFRANAPGYGYFKGEWQFAETVAHWFADGFYPSWCEIACERPIDVSHWMPLPPAPDKQKG